MAGGKGLVVTPAHFAITKWTEAKFAAAHFGKKLVAPHASLGCDIDALQTIDCILGFLAHGFVPGHTIDGDTSVQINVPLFLRGSVA